MNCIVRRLLPTFLLWPAVLTIAVPIQAQDINLSAVVSSRPAITVLDSTKEQDGLLGSVRRVKTETAKIELKDGRPVEGPTQLIEITTYGIKGNRVENTSYPAGGSLVGKEEYKYDERGHITEMTVRDDRGAILSREAYTYEFDKFGNWTKMITSLVVFENGELKREPIEVTYRTVTYYFDDKVAKIVAEPKAVQVSQPVSSEPTAVQLPQPANFEPTDPEPLQLSLRSFESDLTAVGDPPPAQYIKAKDELTVVKSVESAPPVVAPAATAAYELYVTGRDRFDTGDTPGAIESYLQSIKLEPGSAEVHLSLGHAFLRLQKDREAIKAFKDSIKLNPNVAETQYGLGYANFRLGRFREAADAFKKATTIEPRMAKAHYGLSLAYQELGNTTALIEEYRILEKLDRSLARKLAQTFPQFNFSCRLVQGCP